MQNLPGQAAGQAWTENQVGEMAKWRVMLTFPPELIAQPIIYDLGHQFKVVTNIRRAEVGESRGWVVLELEGIDDEIGRGVAWVARKGVRVDPISREVVAGQP